MEKKKQKVVNLIGGPGVGKSIITSDLFSAFKRKGVSCDIAREFIKGLIYEQAQKGMTSQSYIFGNQQFEQFKLRGEVDIIITDCPILLSAVYDSGSNPHFKDTVLHEFNTYDNLVYYISRDKDVPYEEKGRFQKIDGAQKVDTKVYDFLVKQNVPFIDVYGISQESIDFIVEDVITKTNVSA